MSEKMILCKACGKEIAKSAKCCPNCGKKNKKPVGLVLLAIVGFFIVIGVIANLDSGESGESSASTPASAIVQADTNSAQADTTIAQMNTRNAQSNVGNTKPPSIEAIEISPEDLYEAYESNEVKADSIYKGKNIRMVGVVDDIGKDMFNQPYIKFSVDSDGFHDIQIYFKISELSKLGELEQGQKISVV